MEGRDGIGGEMVFSRTRQAAGKSRGTGTQVKAVNPGKAKLIAAVDKEVGEKSDAMAKKLVADFLAGKETSMKMLCALADELIDCENMPELSRVCSRAQTLASERQLAADAIDEEAEKKLDESEVKG